MNSPSRNLLRQLQPMMALILEAVRTCFGSSDHQAREAFQTWQSHYLFPPHHPQHEFCLQTTFIQFVYAYLLRISEEHGLLPPFPTDKQESKTWLASSIQNLLHILNHLD